jgi:hypothetical protein
MCYASRCRAIAFYCLAALRFIRLAAELTTALKLYFPVDV